NISSTANINLSQSTGSNFTLTTGTLGGSGNTNVIGPVTATGNLTITTTPAGGVVTINAKVKAAGTLSVHSGGGTGATSTPANGVSSQVDSAINSGATEPYGIAVNSNWEIV